MTHGLIEASIAGNDDALPLIRGHLTWMEYSDQLPEYLPPDGGPDTFSADYQKVWGTPTRFVEYAGNPSVSVGGGSSDGHRVYLIYQGLIHQTRMATSGNGTKRDVQVILPTAPGTSNEGRSSPLLVLAPPFLGPGFWLGARWNRLVEAVKTRKQREKTGGKWARYDLKRVDRCARALLISRGPG